VFPSAVRPFRPGKDRIFFHGHGSGQRSGVQAGVQQETRAVRVGIGETGGAGYRAGVSDGRPAAALRCIIRRGRRRVQAGRDDGGGGGGRPEHDGSGMAGWRTEQRRVKLALFPRLP